MRAKPAVAKLAVLCASVLTSAVVCSAQTNTEPRPHTATQPDYTSVYCSGFVSDPKVPDDIRLISGEGSTYRIVFEHRDYVYINRGEDKGVKIGDVFAVVRPVIDAGNEWFYGQPKALREMGTVYKDAGQLRVVSVHPKTSIAEVAFSCDYMQRGDIVRPFEERPAPPYKDPGVPDHFAPISGKPVGTIVGSFDFHQELARGDAAYVNIGANKGVKVGDYMRLFRYQETKKDVSQSAGEHDYQYKVFGFGSAPMRYSGKDLPRELLGEGIVLNVTRGAATVLITYSSAEMYAGDFAEIE
jgi:hypothetical protein